MVLSTVSGSWGVDAIVMNSGHAHVSAQVSKSLKLSRPR